MSLRSQLLLLLLFPMLIVLGLWGATRHLTWLWFLPFFATVAVALFLGLRSWARQYSKEAPETGSAQADELLRGVAQYNRIFPRYEPAVARLLDDLLACYPKWEIEVQGTVRTFFSDRGSLWRLLYGHALQQAGNIARYADPTEAKRFLQRALTAAAVLHDGAEWQSALILMREILMHAGYVGGNATEAVLQIIEGWVDSHPGFVEFALTILKNGHEPLG